MDHLRAPCPQDRLVELLALPRVEVRSLVVELVLGHWLETARTRYARQHVGSPYRVAGTPIAIGLGTSILEAQRRALESMAAGSRCEALLEALAAPLERGLGPLWAVFLDDERFASRVAFGLPEPDPGDQTGRFVETAHRVFGSGLPDVGGVLVGQAALEAMTERLSALVRPDRADGVGHLDLVGHTAALAVLVVLGLPIEEIEETRVDPKDAASVLLHDRACLVGRGGPRPEPPWIVEARWRKA